MGEDYDAKYTEKFAESKEAKWLRDNAYKYGFIERFPQGKESQTNRRAEPWHYRYVWEWRLLKKYLKANLH